MPNALNTCSNTCKLRSTGATTEITLSTVAGGTKATKTTKPKKAPGPKATRTNAAKCQQNMVQEEDSASHSFPILPGSPCLPPPEPTESRLPSLSPARPASEPVEPHLPSQSPLSLLDNNNAKLDKHLSDKKVLQSVGGGPLICQFFG
ncbi:hypothetical protein BT96DRAFT_1006765 [Gymnopus androsaceus JB14]|uniref:Uncharacterized protein n=1 Tax=Gymnopus androsaceus JB14 TaxID=1447944 RepID=A0A6A4GKG3_9AGAR|nr:hypothetical protein BT96DRAFT_1006765 [Gymnopus androsaceus JB14]